MLRLFLIMAALIGLTACKQDETVASYDGDKVWTLVEIDGSPYPATATLVFGDDGKVTGKAPCNSYFTEQTKPYPWIEFGPIGSTRMACPDMDAEAAFFDTLSQMTLAEVSGNVMILNNDSGQEMIFKAAQDGD